MQIPAASQQPAADIQETPKPEPISAEVVDTVEVVDATEVVDTVEIVEEVDAVGATPPPQDNSPDIPTAASTENVWPEIGRRIAQKLLDFLLFRRFLTTSITIAIWLLVSVVTIASAMLYVDKAGAIPYLPGKAGHWIALGATLVIVRILCEAFVLVFRINSSTTDVVTDLGISGQGKVVHPIGRRVLDFLILRSMAIVYVTAVAWLIGSLIILFRPLQPANPYRWMVAAQRPIMPEILWRIAMLILWRLACEGIVALYRISETLLPIRSQEGFVRPRGSVGKFFNFQWMVTPWLIRIVWFGGLLVLLYMLGTPLFGFSLWYILAGFFFLRLFCEMMIVSFAIHESYQCLGSYAATRYNVPHDFRPDRIPGPMFFRSFVTPVII